MSRLWFACLSLFNDRCCDGRCVFLGPCAQAHGQGRPCHQGGEGVAGTPGACSQVFCHPISCTSARAWPDTPCPESSVPHHTTHTHHTPHKVFQVQALTFVCQPFCETLAVDIAMSHVERAHGAAQRRRARMVRSWWRHEQMSLAAALAAASHHSAQPYAAPRGQTTGTKAREGEVREQYNGLRAQERPLPGMRPAPLLEVLPQVGLQRHTVEQRIVHTPYVQILDAPVPQKVEQLVDFFKNLDIEVPAQVIEVPKISQDNISQRSVDLVGLGQGSSSFAGPADENFIRVFRTFPRGKKSARVPPRVRVRSCPGGQLMDSGGLSSSSSPVC